MLHEARLDRRVGLQERAERRGRELLHPHECGPHGAAAGVAAGVAPNGSEPRRPGVPPKGSESSLEIESSLDTDGASDCDTSVLFCGGNGCWEIAGSAAPKGDKD